MAIADKIYKSLLMYNKGEISDSLEQCMIATDATAKKIYNEDNNKIRMCQRAVKIHQ
jgi:hypothetical protein